MLFDTILIAAFKGEPLVIVVDCHHQHLHNLYANFFGTPEVTSFLPVTMSLLMKHIYIPAIQITKTDDCKILKSMLSVCSNSQKTLFQYNLDN